MADLIRSVRRWRGSYSRWRRAWDGRVPATLLLVAVVVGLVVGIWLGRWGTPGGTGAAPDTDRARLSEGARGPAGDRGPAALRIERCETVHAAQARPLEELRPALARWEVQMGAMNKLVVGAISPAQAVAFWDRNRGGVASGLATLADAQRALDETAVRCPVPAGPASDRLRACASAVASRQRELDLAAWALGSWRTHVRHMEMLRRGEMTAQEVARAWRASWYEERRQVRWLRHGLRAAQRSTGATCAE